MGDKVAAHIHVNDVIHVNHVNHTMGFIDNLRNKPREQRVRIVWFICIAAAIFLFAVWIITARYEPSGPADTSVFRTIGRGMKDLKKSFSNDKN